MELLLITQKKLKIVLTRADMAEYAITCDMLDYDNTETRRAFWAILDDVKHKIGFDAAEDRIYIQVYPSRDGGCEMYVTKICKKSEEGSVLFSKKKLSFFEKTIYKFTSLENMLSASASLAKGGFSSKTSPSAAFFDESGNYYLKIEQNDEITSPEKRKSISGADLLWEFGERLDSTAEVWLAEHAKCILSDNAVEIYSSLAKNEINEENNRLKTAKGKAVQK